jgi:hypothetical protein
MKRSEMIETIAEALLELYGGDEDEREASRSITKMKRLKIANITLKAAEEAGMPPPFVERIWAAHAQTSFPVSGYEWEKEDE